MNQLQNSRNHHLRAEQLLILDQSTGSGRIKPEAGGNEEQQCESEKKATLSFQAAFTDQLFEGSIRNHESIPAHVPITLQISSQNQIRDQIQFAWGFPFKYQRPTISGLKRASLFWNEVMFISVV